MNSSEKNKVLLFIATTSPFAYGGHVKNLLNLIKFMKPYFKQSNYRVTFGSLGNSESFASDIEKDEILSDIKVDFRRRRFPNVRTIYQTMEFFHNLLQMVKLILKYKPDVIYAYGDKSAYLSSFWKFLFRYKLIMDYRGDGVDERRQKGWNEIKLTILSKADTWCRNRADKIFIVSAAYKEAKKNSKYIIKYNYYDGNLFQFHKDKSIFKKNELGLSDKFVFVYSGGVHRYQMIEEMIFFFADFNKRHQDSFFVVISEYDQDEFSHYFNKYNVSSNCYSIHKLKHEKVSDLLIVGDMAFLIREDLPLNHNAFPTKFAEYLASGVPVLTTPHLHSIAPMVSKNNLGEVTETIKVNKNYNDLIDAIYNKYKSNFAIKNRCASFAQSELMWQKKANEIFHIIDAI